jgi:hypothetical protein
MSGLKARIIKLERSIPTGLEAELASMRDEEIEQEIAELFGVSVEEVRAWTPEEEQRRDDETLADMSEADVLDLMRLAPRLFHGLLEDWRELQRKSRRQPLARDQRSGR